MDADYLVQVVRLVEPQPASWSLNNIVNTLPTLVLHVIAGKYSIRCLTDGRGQRVTTGSRSRQSRNASAPCTTSKK